MLNNLFLTRTLNGKKIDPQEFDALPEFAAICAMCNDSSVDYNTVSVRLYISFHVKQSLPCFFLLLINEDDVITIYFSTVFSLIYSHWK